MIVKFSDYEIITPDLVEKIKKALSASPEYTEAIFSKRGAKEWAESVSGLRALLLALKEEKINSHDVKIKRLPGGKPVFENLPYYFNISHSCGRAVCALSQKEVGVDIEFIKKKRSFDAIAKNFFSDGEQQRFRAAKNKNEEFYRIWTRKEALLKMNGDGIEFGKLKNIDTFGYDGAEFTEIRRGLYLVSVCEKNN